MIYPIKQTTRDGERMNLVKEISTFTVPSTDGQEIRLTLLEEVSTGNQFTVDSSYLELDVGPVISPYGNGQLFFEDQVEEVQKQAVEDTERAQPATTVHVVSLDDNTGEIYCDVVDNKTGDLQHCFWPVANRDERNAATFLVAIKGITTSDIAFPGESVVDAETIISQAEIFQPAS